MKKVMDPDPAGQKSTDPTVSGSSSLHYILGASEVSANMYCNSRTSVLGRLRNYLRLLMKRSERKSFRPSLHSLSFSLL